MMNLFSEKEIFREVIESPEFQRLKEISFLGILDYCFKRNNKTSTRYDHSLAVANMCLSYSRKRNLPEDKKIYMVLAGLLHDIGHCSFSHSLEPVFNEKFAISHHGVTKSLVTNSSNLSRIWLKYSIDYLRIIDTIEGLSNLENKMITKMPINFDTLDGIARTESHFSNLNQAKNISDQIFDILCNHDDCKNQTEYFDLFWKHKQRVYSSYIYNEKQQTAELLFQHCFRKEQSLSKEDFLLTDSQMLSKFLWVGMFINDIKNNCSHGFIRSKIKEKAMVHTEIKSNIRIFLINSKEEFSFNKNVRYLVSSEEKEFRYKDNYGSAIFREVL